MDTTYSTAPAPVLLHVAGRRFEAMLTANYVATFAAAPFCFAADAADRPALQTAVVRTALSAESAARLDPALADAGLPAEAEALGTSILEHVRSVGAHAVYGLRVSYAPGTRNLACEFKCM